MYVQGTYDTFHPCPNGREEFHHKCLLYIPFLSHLDKSIPHTPNTFLTAAEFLCQYKSHSDRFFDLCLGTSIHHILSIFLTALGSVYPNIHLLCILASIYLDKNIYRTQNMIHSAILYGLLQNMYLGRRFSHPH